jgi:hypothetical protein
MADVNPSREKQAATRYGWLSFSLIVAMFAGWIYITDIRPGRRAEDLLNNLNAVGGPSGWEGTSTPQYEGADFGYGVYTVGPGDDIADAMDDLHRWLETLGIDVFEDGQDLFEACYGGEMVTGGLCLQGFGFEGYGGRVRLYVAGWTPGGSLYGIHFELWKV